VRRPVCRLARGFGASLSYQLGSKINLGREVTQQPSTRPCDVGSLAQLNSFVREIDVEDDHTSAFD
jgi:hypothetical protein